MERWNQTENWEEHLVCKQCFRVQIGHGKSGKSWNFIFSFSGMESPGKRLQALRSPRNLLNPEFTLWEMYVDCKNWFWEWKGFRWNSWKNHSESRKSTWKFVSENGCEPCVWTITCIKLNTMTRGTCRGKVWTQVEWPTNWHSSPYHEATRSIATDPGWNTCLFRLT